jgi:hypothetical protein
MHPFAVTPSLNDPGAAQICQMPGNLRLRLLQNLHKVADANLLLSHEVKEAEPSGVAEGLKESFNVKG